MLYGGESSVRKFFLLILIVGLSTSGVYHFQPEVAQTIHASLPTAGVSSLFASSKPLEIIHLDIGQGDATLILGPEVNGKRVSVLMDAGDIPSGGDKDGGAIVLHTLAEYGLTRLDYFVASHYDADHIGGLITGRRGTHGLGFVFGENGSPGALGDDDGDGKSDWLDDNMTQPDPEEFGQDDDFEVGVFVDRGTQDVPSSKTYGKYAALVAHMGTRVSLDTQDRVNAYTIDLGDGATMICYAANGYVRGREKRVRYVNTENERSLCFLIRYGGFEYLLGGDTIGRKSGSENAPVEAAIGESLLRDGVTVDVYHVNHHGANNASATPFLEMIRPECAVISLGDDNRYGHPHADTLERLYTVGVQAIYQTESGDTRDPVATTVRAIQHVIHGPIVLSTDGKTYTIHQTTYKTDS